KVDEPFTKLLTQGMVLNGAFSHKPAGAGINYYWEKDVDVQRNQRDQIIGGTLKADGTRLDYELTTMSKSKSNGVDPQDIIEKYGADTARLYTMFTAPPEATLEWNDAGVEGSYRFLRRVWNFGVKLYAMNSVAACADSASATGTFDKETKALRLEVHSVLKQVDYDYQRMQYNTVVSGGMKLLNALEDFKGEVSTDAVAALREGFGILLRCLYPATPHLTHALWAELGYAAQYGDLLDAPWPEVDASALQQDEIELVLQINGKLRGSVTVPAGADKAAIEAAALASEAFVKQAAGSAAKKVIVVPGRLVNIVV
ncbi:MAG: leucyl-tRNA synthetase, partial [Polaromonas sp.]|nr:leucyl-tRNA synthetase [Polaromonas sp.]